MSGAGREEGARAGVDFSGRGRTRRLALLVFLVVAALPVAAEVSLTSARSVSFVDLDGTRRDRASLSFVVHSDTPLPIFPPACPVTSSLHFGTGAGAERVIELDCRFWLPRRWGYLYRDPSGSAGGVKSITLRARKKGGALVLRLAGDSYGVAAVQGPVEHVETRLRVGQDAYCGRLQAPTARFPKNDAKRVTARGPALACEPLPSATSTPVPATEVPTPEPTPTAGESCPMPFPPLPDDGDGEGEGEPLPDIDPTGLVSWWPMDGNWNDAVGSRHLTPRGSGGFSEAAVALPRGNVAYGPTRSTENNGATAPDFTSFDLSQGLTMETWFYKAGNNVSGVLMGWGDGGYYSTELTIADASGFLHVRTGRTTGRVTAVFPRPPSGCWYHLALVVPPDGVGTMRFFLNGVEATPQSGSLTIGDPTNLFGSPFRLATWGLPESVASRLDEARLWGRMLSPEEIAVRSLARGRGERCPSTTMAWEPGQRCDFLPGNPPLKSASTVRVITDDTVVFLTDPTEALEAWVAAGCGEYLTEMEKNLDQVASWWWPMQYGLAATEAQARYLPPALAAWGDEEFLLVRGCDSEPQPATILSRWTQPVSEWRMPRFRPAGGSVNTNRSRTTWLTWVRLPAPLTDGERVALRDRWGNRVELAYDDDTTISWALKMGQPGFAADDPNKRALLGHFMGPAGPLDLSRFEGAPFQVVRESDGSVAHAGQVSFLAEDGEDSGEQVWSLDFGSLTTPGRYYVRLPGAGRTAAFEIGPDVMGASFLTHARGLYLNRCAPLDAAVSPWARGDIHAVYAGGFPPDVADYRDQSAQGWGFTDAAGSFVSVSSFEAVAASATTTALPGIEGGWHDAGDFDRRSMHLEIVRDLALAYLLAPENFSDGQLDLPAASRTNGRPDILDEAEWGLRAYRTAQQPDGGVGTWIEATSHPVNPDPGSDTQPYYLSLATRDSSLAYARHAALLARALERAGDVGAAVDWLASAEAAWAFGIRSDLRVETSMTVRGIPVTWRERPEPDPERRLLAAVELWLATADPAYRAELDSAAGGAAFQYLRSNAWWQLRMPDLASFALQGASLPVGWGEAALQAIRTQANDWVAGQAQWPFGWAWYAPDHRYVENRAWGQGLYKPLRELVLAWKLTADPAYRHAALLGVAHLTGANPQGRSLTTGLGAHRFVTALHLPSDVDTIAEVSPGITIYGNGTWLAQQAQTLVWGLQIGARTSPRFGGVDLTLLPPPWDNTGRLAAEARPIVDAVLPRWRRIVPLESTLPQTMEFTVWETTGPAAFVTGLLLEPGWHPSAALREETPLSPEAWQDNLWMMP